MKTKRLIVTMIVLVGCHGELRGGVRAPASSLGDVYGPNPIDARATRPSTDIAAAAVPPGAGEPAADMTLPKCARSGVAPHAWEMVFIEINARGADGAGPADIDGDGDIDFIVPFEEGGVAQIYGNRAPEAAEWDSVQVSSNGATAGIEGADFGDLDGDGKHDVVWAADSPTSAVGILWSPVDPYDAGGWSGGKLPGVGSKTWLIGRVAQLDGQNGPDIAITGANEFGWVKGPADPRALASWSYSLVERHNRDRMSTLIAEDVDGDGTVDLVVNHDGGAAWWKNDGHGSFTKHEIGVVGGTGIGRGWGDFVDITGDGHKDLVAPVTVLKAGNHVITWFEAPADPAKVWTKHEIACSPDFELTDTRAPKAAAVADFDQDGQIEIAFNTADAGKHVGDIFLLEYRSSVYDAVWTLVDLTRRQKGKFDELRKVDVDLDGDLDLITTAEKEGLIWMKNPLCE